MESYIHQCKDLVHFPGVTVYLAIGQDIISICRKDGDSRFIPIVAADYDELLIGEVTDDKIVVILKDRQYPLNFPGKGGKAAIDDIDRHVDLLKRKAKFAVALASYGPTGTGFHFTCGDLIQIVKRDQAMMVGTANGKNGVFPIKLIDVLTTPPKFDAKGKVLLKSSARVKAEFMAATASPPAETTLVAAQTEEVPQKLVEVSRESKQQKVATLRGKGKKSLAKMLASDEGPPEPAPNARRETTKKGQAYEEPSQPITELATVSLFRPSDANSRVVLESKNAEPETEEVPHKVEEAPREAKQQKIATPRGKVKKSLAQTLASDEGAPEPTTTPNALREAKVETKKVPTYGEQAQRPVELVTAPVFPSVPNNTMVVEETNAVAPAYEDLIFDDEEGDKVEELPTTARNNTMAPGVNATVVMVDNDRPAQGQFGLTPESGGNVTVVMAENDRPEQEFGSSVNATVVLMNNGRAKQGEFGAEVDSSEAVVGVSKLSIGAAQAPSAKQEEGVVSPKKPTGIQVATNVAAQTSKASPKSPATAGSKSAFSSILEMFSRASGSSGTMKKSNSKSSTYKSKTKKKSARSKNTQNMSVAEALKLSIGPIKNNCVVETDKPGDPDTMLNDLLKFEMLYDKKGSQFHSFAEMFFILDPKAEPKVGPNDDIVSFTTDAITQPLTAIEEPAKKKMAVECFKLLMQYMGDMETKMNPRFILHFVIEFAANKKELHMELFCQAMKQLNHNRSTVKRSLIKGWTWLIFLCAHISPGSDLENFLVAFIQRAHEFKPGAKEFAEIAMDRLRKNKITPRITPPSYEEIYLTEHKSPQAIFVKFLDPTEPIQFLISSHTRSMRIVHSICSRLGISNVDHYGLYIQFNPGEFFIVPVLSEGNIYDSLNEAGEIFEELRQNSKLGFKDVSIVFMRKLWLSSDGTTSPSSFQSDKYLSVLFYQVARYFTSGAMFTSRELEESFGKVLFRMVALMMRAKELIMDDEEAFRRLIPDIVYSMYEADVWDQHLGTLTDELLSITASEAMKEYLELAKQFSLHGSSFFKIFGSNDKRFSSGCILAVSEAGATIVDKTTRNVVQIITHSQIKSMIFEETEFVMTFNEVSEEEAGGNGEEEESELILETRQAWIISDTIKSYKRSLSFITRMDSPQYAE